MSGSRSQTPIAIEVLRLLPLDLSGLSGPQRRGAICVWGGESLGPDAVDLDPRTHEGTRVFPRACPRCAAGHPAAQTPAPRLIWCNWHKGLADTCLLIQSHEQGTGIHACAKCRETFRLAPREDRP